MRRALPTLLAAGLVAALFALAAASASNHGRDGQTRVAGVVAPLPAESPITSVPPASGAVLAEMERRLGTPRRVARSALKRGRLIRRIEARIRTQERATAARRAAAARAAAAAKVIGDAPYWFDQAAAAHTTQGPATPEEAQWLNSGRGGWVEANGYARAPIQAPQAIKRVIEAGNLIARSPYRWGGGHGVWQDKGYDCSGSVSYALAAGGMLGWSQTSGQLMNWGVPGPGRWLTIYASPTHVFLMVAGLRFDTSGRAGDHASRWQLGLRSADGFEVRHYPGL